MSVTVSDLLVRFRADTGSSTNDIKALDNSIKQMGDDVESSSRKAESGLNRIGQSARSAGEAMSNAGKNLTVGLTAPLVGLGKLAFDAGTSLNAGLANVGALGVPMQRINELKANIQSLQVSTGKSSTDLTGGLYQVISAFGDSADAAKILEINAKSATAGVAETVDAINLTSAVTKGYGDTSAEAVQHASDLALATVRMGQTTFPELASSIGKVIPLAKSLGVSQEEVFAAMATGTGVTGGAAEVATQYRGILQSLMAPTDSVTTLMKNMGFANGEAMIKQLGFMNSTKLLVQAAEATGAPLQNFIGSIEGQTLALALTGAQADKYIDNLKNMGAVTGETDKAFKAQTEGANKLGFMWAQTRQKLDVFLARLYDAVAPTIADAAEAIMPFFDRLTGLVDIFTNLDPVTQRWILSAVGIAAAIGPTLLVVGKLTSLFGGMLTTLPALAGGLGTVLVPLGLLYAAYRLNLFGLRNLVDNGLTRLRAAAPSAVGALRETVAQLTGIGLESDGTTESIEKFVTALSGSEAAGQRAGEWVANLATQLDHARAVAASAGGGITGAIAGIGSLTGASVTVDVKSQVTAVDWKGALGDLSYVYDAKAKVLSVDWKGSVANLDFTYDAKSKITTVDYKGGGTGEHEQYVYDAKAQVLSVDWTSKLDESMRAVYDAKAAILNIDWVTKNTNGTFEYKAGAGITKVEWHEKAFSVIYDAHGTIIDVLWGAYTHVYNAGVQVTSDSVLWGAYTHKYNAQAQVTENNLLWGTYTHTYDAKAQIDTQSIYWGVGVHTYNAAAKIDSHALLWGAYTHTYDAKAQVDAQSVLWGAYSHTYDAKAGIAQNSVLWGAWTYTYDAKGKIIKVDWGIFTKIYDVTARITSWLQGSPPPSPTAPGGFKSINIDGSADYDNNPQTNGRWMGDPHWKGGTALVGEKGPELVNLPRGTQIFSNPNTKKMLGGVAAFAEGNTGLPTGLNAAQSAGFEKFIAAQTQKQTETQNKAAEKIARASDRAAEKTATALNHNAEQITSALEGMLGKVPGLMHTSDVTQQQMDMAKLGVPQDFADNWIRRLTDEVVNGVQWDDVDIKDAAQRAGIDPSLPAKAILEMVKEQWNDKSFFADATGKAKNTDLINMDAVKADLLKQTQQAAGQANILQLFGIPPDQVQAQTAAAVTQIAQGLSTGMGQANGQLMAQNIIAKTAKAMTPEAMAPVGAALAAGIGGSLTASTDKDGKNTGIDIGTVIAGGINSNLANSKAFDGTGTAILGKITESWGDPTNGVDLSGAVAKGMRTQLGDAGAIDDFVSVGNRIGKLLQQGIEEYFRDSNLASSVGAGVGAPVPSSTPGFASGTGYAPGGLAWVGERGKELVKLPRGSQVIPHNQSVAIADTRRGGDIHYHMHATINNQIDEEAVFHRWAKKIQRVGR